MSQSTSLPQPLFDTLENLYSPEHIVNYLQSLALPGIENEFQFCLEFLKSYSQSRDTFTAYRRELERFLQWAWLVQKKPLKQITRNDVREYLEFIRNPPTPWIAIKTVERFITNGEGARLPNPEWRPFVVKLSKLARSKGATLKKSTYQLSNKSVEAIFATLSSFFVFLQQENYLEVNPISLIRQKKGYIQRQQTIKVTRKLSRLQWNYVISEAENMANEDQRHERTFFLMSAFYLLGLRISELAYADDRMALMNNFAPDKNGLWWYTTVGKGNKMRDVAVPDELLQALKRYRESLGLTSLPNRGESLPLFPKLKGRSGLGTRQIRNIVQSVFDRAIEKLRSAGKIDEAEDLATATVHWLRHTAISNEVEFRPREHIRDDVGHENPATMEKYIDTDRVARHQSAQTKRLKPEKSEAK
ncbi:MAG TPA: site-specific integrase [Gammaproteobacteria bacterium]|nr:site-specific integrase [Gammaproteobacteria bacterium]